MKPVLENTICHICACDSKGTNTILKGNKCVPCPADKKAVQIFPEHGNNEHRSTPIYKCVKCNGGIVTDKGECSCPTNFILLDGECIPCPSGTLFNNLLEPHGECIPCAGKGAFINEKGNFQYHILFFQTDLNLFLLNSALDNFRHQSIAQILKMYKDDVTANTKVTIKSMTLVSLSRVALVSNMVQMVVYHAVESDQLLLGMNVFVEGHIFIPVEFAVSVLSIF